MIAEILLALAALSATLAAFTRDDAYAGFSLGSAILFVSLYIIGRISPLIGVIVFAVYTASVIAIVFMAIGEREGGIGRLAVVGIPLALAVAVILYAAMPEYSASTIAVSIEPLRELVIPIAAGLASVIAAAQEVRAE